MKHVSVLVLILIFFTACKQDNHHTQEELGINFYEFFKDFSNLKSENLQGGVVDLNSKYPQFCNFFMDTLMQFGPCNPPTDSMLFKLNQFITYKDYKWLNDTIVKIFPSTKNIDQQLLNLLGEIKSAYKDWQVPSVYYFTSGLKSYPIVLNTSYIGVGLDMYIGEKFRYYPSIQIPDHLLKERVVDKIPVDVARIIAEDFYPYNFDNINFISCMIAEGKLALFQEKMLPEVPINKFFNCSEEQLEWMVENENEVWNFFLKHEILFKSDVRLKYLYLKDAPTSSGMPALAPGRTGCFVGYKIVKSYMRNQKLSFNEVMKEQNLEKIYTNSNYKPR